MIIFSSFRQVLENRKVEFSAKKVGFSHTTPGSLHAAASAHGSVVYVCVCLCVCVAWQGNADRHHSGLSWCKKNYEIA